MSYRIGSVQVSKVQLALLVGTPLAIGLGIYIYKRACGSTAKDDVADRTNIPRLVPIGRKRNANGTDRQKTLSLDGTAEDKELERKKKQAELESEQLSPLKEATAYKNEGNICYRNGKYDEAIIFYDKAIDKCPDENRADLSIFYQNRAAAYEMLKRWSAVKDDCTRSLDCNPRYAKAYFRRAKAHEATNDLLSCLDDVTATCILEMFGNNNTIMYADRILKQSGREESDRAMKTRVPVLPSNSFIDTYMRSFVADPLQLMPVPAETISEPARGFLRAKLALDDGRHEDVIAACTEEIESSEAESTHKMEALLMRGTYHLLSGSFDDSQLDLDTVINNVDAPVELRTNAYLKRASLFIQLDEKDKGLHEFEEAERIMPDNPDIYHQRAQIFMLIDQLSEALDEFERALKLAPKHAMAYVQKCYCQYRLAMVKKDQMRLSMVMNEFTNAIEKFPDCVECLSLMAQVLCDQQQFPQADLFYKKAIQMAPNNAALYVHRGIMVLQWQGDINLATELMTQALKVDDKCELAYETLGTVEVQRANLDRAVELFERAVKLAKSQSEMSHLYALRNAALAQIKVTRQLGIDMSTISALAQTSGTGQ